MNRRIIPSPYDKQVFVNNLRTFIKDVENQGGKEKFDNFSEEFKKFYKPENNEVFDQDFFTIKYWVEDLDEYLMTQTKPDPKWGYNDEGKLYIKGWDLTPTVRGEVHHWYGPMRKSKKQRKSRKNTRKSRKNTRNNRKRRT